MPDTATETPRLYDVPPDNLRTSAAIREWYAHQEKMAQATRSTGPSVTVDLDSNAKRETIPKVQIVAAVGTDEATLRAHAEMVTRVAMEQYETITARYPAASGFTTNDGPKG
jgi:hypothetical protein